MSSSYRLQIRIDKVGTEERAKKIIDCICASWPEQDLTCYASADGACVLGGGDEYISGFVEDAIDKVVTDIWTEVGYVPIEIDYLYLEELPYQHASYDYLDFLDKKSTQ